MRYLVSYQLGIGMVQIMVQIVYAASNVNVPNETIYTIKNKIFGFLWNNKKDKIKRESIYEHYDKGGIRITDVDIMIN